jgi:hypothetical protein
MTIERTSQTWQAKQITGRTKSGAKQRFVKVKAKKT